MQFHVVIIYFTSYVRVCGTISYYYAHNNEYRNHLKNSLISDVINLISSRNLAACIYCCVVQFTIAYMYMYGNDAHAHKNGNDDHYQELPVICQIIDKKIIDHLGQIIDKKIIDNLCKIIDRLSKIIDYL